MRHLDPCHCGGTMKRYATKTLGRVRTRYLKCDRCEATDQEVFYVDDRGRPLYASTFTPADKRNIASSSSSPSIEVTTIARGDHGQDTTGMAEH